MIADRCETSLSPDGLKTYVPPLEVFTCTAPNCSRSHCDTCGHHTARNVLFGGLCRECNASKGNPS